MAHEIVDQFRLDGKLAVVTGASRGLGQGMAVGLAQAGADLVLLSTDAANLNETKDSIAALGRRTHALTCDVSQSEQIERVIDQILDRIGPIDILVNNAGTIRRAPAAEYSDADWERVIQTNLTGLFQLCRKAGKSMVARERGKIINIASLLSFSGGLTVPAYAASKGGVAQLTKALANEWAPHNVQVNAIAPGYFETDNTAKLRSDRRRFEEISARIPAGRWGVPADLQGAVVFLASGASDYVNGHILLVDGGWMAR